jgi:hypothetical protein
VVERGLHVIERGRAAVLRSQPIVDRDDEAVGRPGQFDAVRVIGVQISGDEDPPPWAYTTIGSAFVVAARR